MSAYLQLIRWYQPIGTWLLLLPTLWALWAAYTPMPPISMILVFSAGALIMRSLGCVVNDITDAAIDSYVQRSKHRPLAAKTLSIYQAWCCAGVLLILAFFLWCFLSIKTQLLALVALPLIVIYPRCKQFFFCPQLVLAICFSWGMLMVFTEAGSWPMGWQWLVLANMFWVLFYDGEYALQDYEDDRRIGLHSLVTTCGAYIGIVLKILASLMWCSLALFLGINPWSVMVLLIIAGLLTWQLSIAQHDPGVAFRSNQWLGLVVLLYLVGHGC